MDREGLGGLNVEQTYRRVDPARDDAIGDLGEVVLGPLEVRLYKVGRRR